MTLKDELFINLPLISRLSPRRRALCCLGSAALFACSGTPDETGEAAVKRQAATAVTPAAITGTTTSGVGFVTASGTSTIDATIGRWDTAYPNPDTGERAPGLEPSGASSLTINVDVHDGGLVTFRYQLLSYDAGVYDWLDITMQTPDGAVPIVQKLGKPGGDYGTYWESANIAVSQSLDKWRNGSVGFVFSVQQDGWGDQTAAFLRSFAVTTCHVPPLTALTDAAAQRFEAGDTVNTTGLNAATSGGLTCMQQAVQNAGGTMSVSSAYRPPQYQQHLREVWDGWQALRNDSTAECADLKTVYRTEFTQHGLLLTQRPASSAGPHTQGNAFDANISGLPAGQTQDTIAAGCNMWRRLPTTDPVHYEPRP